MNVTVIPFFLAASIGVNIDDWKYGPEVIYDARINYFHNWHEDIGFITASNITTKLKCRPKSEFVLSCGFTKPKFLLSLEKDKPESRDFLMGLSDDIENVEDRFELNYGMTGIESIVGSSKSKIELIRFLANELNVPIHFFDLSVNNNFDVMENSKSGLCKTNYIVMAINADDYDNDDDVYEDSVKPYNFTMIIAKKMPHGEIKKILRMRNLNECSKNANNFISGQGIIIEKNTTSSRSHMTLTAKGFSSWTENTIITRIKQLFGIPAKSISKIFDVPDILKETITLTLDKIVPANQPLPTIEEPVTVGIFSV